MVKALVFGAGIVGSSPAFPGSSIMHGRFFIALDFTFSSPLGYIGLAPW